MLGQRPTILGGLEAEDVARAWGFEPKALLTWVKTTKAGAVDRGGMGWYFRGATEHVIFAVRGAAGIPSADRLPNVFMAPRSGHSRKPGVLFEIAERCSPAPRVELFARERRLGWEAWGNEVESTVEVAA
jgi:N6-adenosine-specific RNA methylase IME4